MANKKVTAEIFEKICQRIEESELGLTKICAEFNISRQCFLNWKEKNQSNIDRYARAKEEQMDYMAERIIEIADDSSNDTTISEFWVTFPDSEFINRSRLRVDARKWLMAKLKPNKYGEKLDLTTQGQSINRVPTEIKTPDGKSISLE